MTRTVLRKKRGKLSKSISPKKRRCLCGIEEYSKIVNTDDCKIHDKQTTPLKRDKKVKFIIFTDGSIIKFKDYDAGNEVSK